METVATCVVTEGVATEFSCRDRESSRLKVSRSRHMFLCHDRIFPRHNRDWPRKEILCRDKGCVVTTERAIG